ncbi:transglycosylase SLT domain-containing protein [candidate division KSB1 bacterium]|nr:transglycosylase SLT domain-containing protein [candidate division KSB1 bacterium]
MQSTGRKKNQHHRIKVYFLALLISGLAVFNFTFKIYTIEESSVKLDRLVHSVQDLQAALNLDGIRWYHLQKVIVIINKFNQGMDEKLKYEIAKEVYEMSIKYPNLDVDLICATITHESAKTWRPEITSTAGAMGLMQIMPTTGILLAKTEGIAWTSASEILYNPIYNIRMGCRYLSKLIEHYDTDGGLAAYNGGARRAELWIANNKDYSYLWDETRQYIPAILKLYEHYKNLGDPHTTFAQN